MEVKGTAVIAIRDFVKDNYSSQYNKWLNSLSLQSKAIFNDAIDSTKWYPVEAGAKEPTEKIGQLFFNGNAKKGAHAAGRYSAQKALNGIYKIFIKAATPSYIIKRASRVFSTYYRPCELVVVGEPIKGIEMEMSKITKRHQVIEERIAGWMQTALELSGCKDVSIVATLARKETDGDVIKFEVNWN